jgi:hypothetical protein
VIIYFTILTHKLKFLLADNSGHVHYLAANQIICFCACIDAVRVRVSDVLPSAGEFTGRSDFEREQQNAKRVKENQYKNTKLIFSK